MKSSGPPCEAKEKERNIKIRRPLFAVVLSLLVGIIWGLVGGSSPALAVVSLASFTLNYNARTKAFASGTASASVNVADSLPAH
jgi:hypothetical protein